MSDYHAEQRWRTGDPETSIEAAKAIEPHLPDIQAQVEAWARSHGAGGFTDLELTRHFDDETSTYRTRRSELTDRNIILDSGRKRREEGSERQRIVWVHRHFVTNPPAMKAAPVKATEADRVEARDMVAELRSFARYMRPTGRAKMADRLEQIAEKLLKLAS